MRRMKVSNRPRQIRKWFRKKMRCASSEGTRHWITRLSRKQDHNYHELRNEIDQLRQKLTLEIEKTREGSW